MKLQVTYFGLLILSTMVASGCTNQTPSQTEQPAVATITNFSELQTSQKAIAEQSAAEMMQLLQKEL